MLSLLTKGFPHTKRVPQVLKPCRTSNTFRFNNLNKFLSSNKFSSNPKYDSQYSAIVTKADSSLASSMWDKFGSDEDRFNLSRIHDVKKLFLMLRQVNYNYPLNDLIHFLKRITQLNEEKNLKLTVKNSQELETFIREIKRNLRQATQEYPLIGSFAWCFWKLNYHEDQELWLTLGDYIIDGRFHPNFNESMCGLEGFTVLNGLAEPEFIDEVYKRLEKILVLTIIEVNITHYKRITESLVKVGRFTNYVFENIENHLMHFLQTHEVEYDLRLMLDILGTFAIGGNGSENMFYSFENIFNRFLELSPEEQKSLANGYFIGNLIQTYALAKMRYPDIVMEQNFEKMVYDLVVDETPEYSLEDLVNVVEYVPMFGFPQIEDINKLLDDRLFKVKGDMKCDDMIRYIDLKVLRDCDEDYSKLSKDVVIFFDNYLNKNMEKQAHQQIYKYITEIETRDLMYNKEEFLNHLVAYVSNKVSVYDFEEMCYFYWLFNKYFSMIDMESAKVQCELSVIKDHIRLFSSFSKGRLKIGSNFYKMLEVVSGSDFLTQGEYPEW